MKTHGLIRIIAILIILLLIVCVWKHYFAVEGFDSSPLQMYVISLKHADRMANIKKQEEKIGQTITIFDAVKGDFVDIEPLIAAGVLDKKYKTPTKREKREIGCYMSHLQLIQQINQTSGYTIIFEDDFNIVSNTFLQDLSAIFKTLEEKQIDFDLLFLGTLTNNKGDPVVDTVYKQNKGQDLWGTHAYIVNNKHLAKILDGINVMDRPIDNQYDILGRQDKLINLMIDPAMVNQQVDTLGSTIGDFSIETFL
jgi:GR25 family glycosyltransferase involved in LPS biosynthesis